MNPRERILAAIHHQPVDRLPTDIWATPEIWQKLRAYCGVETNAEVYGCLEIDGIFQFSPAYIGPPLRVEDGIHYNEWGMGSREQEVAGGVYLEQVVFPLAQAETLAELEAFPFPSLDWYDYAAIAAQAALHPERARMCGYTAVFFYHNKLRGLERSLRDPLERPEFTRRLVERISDFFNAYHRRCFEASRGWIDLTQVTDDFGSQHGLLISPRLFDAFYRPAMQRAIDLAHEFGITVFHHDDGDLRRLLPRLVEMGVEVLNPLQWRCGGWDLAALKSEFGSRLCFHGGVDNQHTLPFGTVEDVRAEVRWLKRTLASDGTGYILAPCHNLQPITPLPNILEMYAEARR